MMARLILIALACLATTASSQSREQRWLIIDDLPFALTSSPPGAAESVKAAVLGMTNSVLVPVNIQLFGAADCANSGSFFVCGYDEGAGIIQFVVYNAATQSFSLGARYSESGSDFVGVVWDKHSSTVFALDAGKSRLVAFFAYEPGDPLLAPVTVLNSSVFPPLGAADNLTLLGGADSTKLFVHTYGKHLGEHDHWVLTPGTSSWAIEFKPGRNRSSYLDPDELTVGASQVGVAGPSGVKIRVVKISGPGRIVSELGHATMDAQGSGTVTLSAPLEAGEIYATRSDAYGSDVLPPYASPVYRVGTVETLGDQVEIQPISGALALVEYVGNSRFEVPLFANVTDIGIAPPQFQVSLAVGSAGDVTQVNGRHFLAAPVVMDATLHIFKEGRDGGLASVPLPIPADGALAGAVIYYQWWVSTGPQSLALSNIIGAPIRGTRFVPFGLEEYMGWEGGDALAGGSFSSEAKRVAVEEWLRDCGARELTPQERQEVRALLRN